MTRPRDEPIAVVTVTYESTDVLPDFVASVRAATARPVRVIVVDNDSRDIEELRRLTAELDVELVEMGANRGYGAAMNAGAALVDGDVALLANPDVVFDAGSLDVLLAALTTTGAGAVGPLVRQPDGTAYPSARNLPSLRTGLGHALLGETWPENPWTRQYHAGWTVGSEIRSAGWLSGSCLLVNMSAFREIGGFDDGYFMYFEDVDLGLRLGQAGWDRLFEPRAAVTHVGAHSTRRSPEKMIRAHHASARRYFRRKSRGPLLWPLRVAVNSGLRVREAITARRARRTAQSG